MVVNCNHAPETQGRLVGGREASMITVYTNAGFSIDFNTKKACLNSRFPRFGSWLPPILGGILRVPKKLKFLNNPGLYLTATIYKLICTLPPCPPCPPGYKFISLTPKIFSLSLRVIRGLTNLSVGARAALTDLLIRCCRESQLKLQVFFKFTR